MLVLAARLENAGDIPLLSVSDVRIMIAKEIRSKFDYDCNGNRGEKLKKGISKGKTTSTDIMNSIYQSRINHKKVMIHNMNQIDEWRKYPVGLQVEIQRQRKREQQTWALAQNLSSMRFQKISRKTNFGLKI
jgi:hypothetical protein